jgi:CubicO group peptidase (beta-lactamase class C family)
MRVHWRRLGSLAFAAIAVFAGVNCASAQPAAASLDQAKVQTWIDAYFADTMAKTHVPGAVVVVVDHGRIVVLKGYGVRTPGGTPIDPQTTLFRLGSITKTLTAITATQMIDEGKIDPAQDVNRYLTRIQVPATYAPITIADLLAHEGGFGAELRGVDAPTNAEANTSPAETQRLLVPRVRPPGEYIAYDNNGWGVLGLALADASHTTYRQLIADRIFRPLGMTHAVIGVPDRLLPTAIEEHYVLPDGKVERIDHSLLRPMEQGAGDASATGADMARYMIALLQQGQIDGRRILSPAEFHVLTDFDAHRIHPMLPGYARAFYEDRPAGHFAIRHDGGMRGSASSMVLYPQEQIGVFFAINARPYNPFDGETLTGVAAGIKMFLFDPKPKVSLEAFLHYLDIHEQFAKKFLPPAAPVAIRVQGEHTLTDAEIAGLAGKYVATSSQFASFIGALQVGLIEGVIVQPGGHGTVLIGGKRYRQIEPDLFENEAGDRQSFRVTPYGAFLGPAALWIKRRVPAYDNPVLTIVPLLLLPFFLVCAVFYRFSLRPLYREMGTAIAVLAIVYVSCLALEGQYATYALVSNRMWMAHLWRLALQIALIGLVLWPALLIRGWWQEAPTWRVRGIAAAIHFGLMALFGWALVLLAGYWNLIGKL